MRLALTDGGGAGAVWLWILLTVLWFSANSSLQPESIAMGALISAGVAVLFASPGSAWADVGVSPRRLYHFLCYTGVFFVELVRANLNMARCVLSQRIALNPGVIEIKTRLKTPIARLALANSISLTPGSLVLDVVGDSLFIHWLDVKTTDPVVAARLIAAPFEGHLEQAFE